MTDTYGYIQREIERQGHFTEFRDGKMIYSDKSAVELIVANYNPLPDAKADAIKRIREQAQSLMAKTEESYPSFERQTWPYQRLEVEAWERDNTASTPTIDAIALSKEVSREGQILRTIEKINEFKFSANHLVGRRQYFERLIKSSDDIDFVASINFEV